LHSIESVVLIVTQSLPTDALRSPTVLTVYILEVLCYKHLNKYIWLTKLIISIVMSSNPIESVPGKLLFSVNYVQQSSPATMKQTIQQTFSTKV